MTNALIVVDVQNDFAHPDGNLYVLGGEYVARKVSSLASVNEYNGNLVVYTKDWHPAITGHFDEHGGPWPTHCVAGTWGSEFHSALHVVEGSPVVLKGTRPDEDGYSGFSVERDGDVTRTELHDILHGSGVTNVIVAGIALDVCVKATALDAAELGYDVTVYEKLSAPVTIEGGREAIAEMRKAGITVYER